MQALLAQLWAAHGLSVLLVTHDVEEALRLADRVVVLERGQISATLDVAVPRPRQLTDLRLAALRREALRQLGVTGTGDPDRHGRT